MICVNDYFSLIIQIQSFWFSTLAPVETQMLPSEERRHTLSMWRNRIEMIASLAVVALKAEY